MKISDSATFVKNKIIKFILFCGLLMVFTLLFFTLPFLLLKNKFVQWNTRKI